MKGAYLEPGLRPLRCFSKTHLGDGGEHVRRHMGDERSSTNSVFDLRHLWQGGWPAIEATHFIWMGKLDGRRN